MQFEEISVERYVAIQVKDAVEAAVRDATRDALIAGEERGREESREEGREFVARNALAEGVPLDLISKITGLDAGTIQSFAGQ